MIGKASVNDVLQLIRDCIESFRVRIPPICLKRAEGALSNSLAESELRGSEEGKSFEAGVCAVLGVEKLGSLFLLRHPNGKHELVDAGVWEPGQLGISRIAFVYNTRSYSTPFQIARAAFYFIEQTFPPDGKSFSPAELLLIIEWKEKVLLAAKQEISLEAKGDLAHEEWDMLISMIENLRRFTRLYARDLESFGTQHYAPRAQVLELVADVIVRRIRETELQEGQTFSRSRECAVRALYNYLNQLDKDEAWSKHIQPFLDSGFNESLMRTMVTGLEVGLDELEFAGEVPLLLLCAVAMRIK